MNLIHPIVNIEKILQKQGCGGYSRMNSKVVSLFSYKYERYLKEEGYIVKKDDMDNIKIAIRIKDKKRNC